MSSSDEESASGREEEEERRSSDEEDEEEEEENGTNSQDGLPAHSSAKQSARSKSTSLNSLAFPISRVRRLVKSEGDMQWVGVEAGYLIAKAAELFLEKFVEDSFTRMTDDERTTLSYKDLAAHVSSSERLEFLADFVPELVPSSTALSVKGMADK